MRIWEWISTGSILEGLYVTLLEALLAFVIGSVLGMLVGFGLARMPLLADVWFRALSSEYEHPAV